MPFSVVPGHGQSADHPRMPGRKQFSATLGTIFMKRAEQVKFNLDLINLNFLGQ